MNRRVFLTALGAVATQKRFGTFDAQLGPDGPDGDVQPTFTVTRFPYLQNVRNDRASILWATLEAGFGQVRYTTDGVNFRVANAHSHMFARNDTGLLYNYFQYQADIVGLSPNTDYLYTVSIDGQDISAAGDSRLRTAGAGPFNFIVLGDSGWGGPRSDAQGQIGRASC